MKNIKLTLAYDGTAYLGWQVCPDGPTIEGTLHKVLAQILQEEITLQAVSRTDAGVHAEKQVVNFFTGKEPLDLDRLKISLNQMLPRDIRIGTVEMVDDAFHPTLDAKGKEYHYHITHAPIQLPFERHFAWHYYSPLDFAKIEEALPLFIGKHDFAALCNANEPRPKDTIRTLHRLDLIRNSDERFHFEVYGDRFLYKMVRNLIGTLIYIGAGKLSFDDAKNLLASKDRTLAGMTAPACGLILKTVYY